MEPGPGKRGCVCRDIQLMEPQGWFREVSMKLIDRIALALLIIGGLNWGSIGLFGLDLVAALFGGSASGASRLVYILVCLSALWCVTLFFRERSLDQTAQSNA